MSKHRKSAMGRSRDIGTGNNGKGDKSRVTSHKAYADGYDAINWGPRDAKNGHDGVPGVDGFQCLKTPPNAIINPAWETAPYGIEEPPAGPRSPDFENWDR